MIRKAIIVILTFMAIFTSFLWADSYRNRITLPFRGELTGRPFPGWCTDLNLKYDRGLHTSIRSGGICVSYRSPVIPNEVGAERSIHVTHNLLYNEYAHTDYRPCIRNAEHHFQEPKGMRLVEHAICLPLWFLLIVFAAYPTITFIRGPLRRYRRHRKGLCVTCGYNLTGNISGTCPECGTSTKI